MLQYDPITNERLRRLVMASESIHSLPEENVRQMVMQIANLDSSGESALIQTLEDEQRQIAAAKRAKGLTPEMELARINENMAKMSKIKHDFEMSVLKENDREETQKSAQAADELLKNIN
jgi:hypothetical protein